MAASISDSIQSVLGDPVYGTAIFAVIIIVAAWVATRVVNGFISHWRRRVLERVPRSGIAPAETRFAMIRRLSAVAIYFLAAMLILLQIPQARAVGATLLATAGVLGIVAGLAGQATLSNLIAGIALAFSQPVRLSDAVIYEGEWGWVEEITLMHTVIRTWDNRRLIVPNSVLYSTVIQNWTIKDEWLLAVVMVYVDYTCDVEQLRRWAKEIVDASTSSTDERISVVQVVDFTEKSMVVRILGKCPDASSTWNLRCEIREKLIQKFNDAGLPLPEIRIGPPPAGIRPD